MQKTVKHRMFKSSAWVIGAGFFLLSVLSGPIVGSWTGQSWTDQDKHALRNSSLRAKKTMAEFKRLGLLDNLSPDMIDDLLDYQMETGKSLVDILKDPKWAKCLGFTTNQFRSTWYAANPYQLLPIGLQEAIREHPIPFQSRSHVWQWCRKNKIPLTWRKALYAALIETTPRNLSRASQGQRPFANNGEYLEPIVVDHGNGEFEVRDGHIATDPRLIPTNSEVLLLVRIKGEERILRAKATDVGGGIKGKHVDLPIHLNPRIKSLPELIFPSEIKNPTVTILTRTAS